MRDLFFLSIKFIRLPDTLLLKIDKLVKSNLFLTIMIILVQ